MSLRESTAVPGFRLVRPANHNGHSLPEGCDIPDDGRAVPGPAGAPSSAARRATNGATAAAAPAVHPHLDPGDVPLARELRQAAHELRLEEPHMGGQRGVVAHHHE